MTDAIAEVACEELDALLAAHGDGTLAAGELAQLQHHLASCASCRAVADTLSPRADRVDDQHTLPRVDPAGYALGLEVARGGMGRILAARDLRIGRPIAVKQLLGGSPQLATRFEREARVTARLQHPGIVPIYEIGVWPDGTPFYTMRMVDGRTLHEAIDAASSLAARLALLPALIAACEAVAFAHNERVIHRDLTPSNVLVGAYGETVVIDWGLAKDLADPTGEPAPAAGPYRDDAASGLTGAGAVIGTAAYMPPEQANAEEVDERADVYALGAILYHLLAGASPYRGVATAEVLAAVKAGPPRAIEAVAPRAPRDLQSIAGKAMARVPDQRYRSARELADELIRFQAGRMVEAHSYSRRELVRRFVRRHRAAVAVTTAALSILAIVGAISISRIVRSRAATRETLAFVLEEQGRTALLAGDTQRAVAYLDAARQRGADSPALHFLLGTAFGELATEERTLDCGSNVRFLEFSPDGTIVAAGCRDAAKLWRLADGKLVATLLATGDATTRDGFDGIRFSHDGTTLATWGKEGVVRLWDARTGALRHAMPHGAEITFVTFTPDDARVASSGFDGTAKLWRVATGALDRTIVVSDSTLFGHVYGLLSPNGTDLLTVTIAGDGDGWNIDTGAHLGGFHHHALVLGGDVSRDGRYASSCGMDRLANVWNATTGEHVATFAGHTDVVWKCVFSVDGRLLLTTSHDGTARVWDIARGQLLTSVTHGDIVWTGHFSPDGRRFLTVGVDEFMRVWDTRTGNLLSTHATLGGKDAQWSPDGSRLVVEGGDGRIRIWRETSGALVDTFTPVAGSIAGVTRDGRHAIVADGGALTIWDIATDRPRPHAAIVEPFALGDTDIAGTTATGVDVLALATGETRATIAAPSPRYVALSRAGDRVLIATATGAPRVWDVATGAPRVTFAGATDAALDPGGTRALAWTPGQRPVVWDLDTRQPIATLAITVPMRVVGFAADRVVLADDPDGASHAISLWSTVDGAPLHTEPDALRATLDPSGTYVTTVGNDRVIRAWRTRDGGAHASFVSDRLSRAQIDPSGELVAAIGEYGTAALVLNARDGRVLAHWTIAHAAPTVTQLDFIPPVANAWWSPDASSVVAESASVAVWSARDRSTPDELARKKRKVPWQIVDGRVEPIRGRLHGRVVRGEVAVAGLAIHAEIRKPPYLAGGEYNWQLAKSQVRVHAVTTGADGRFELGDLPAGEYALAVPGLAPIDVDVSVEDEELAIAVP